MNEFITNCPVCSGLNFTEQLVCTDYTVSKERFSLKKCTSCRFVFTNPRPAPEAIGNYYQSEEYISHTNSSKGIKNKLYQFARKKAVQSKLNLLEEQGALPKSLLDYGCGTGEFLGFAQKSGWLSKGIELDSNARAKAIANHQLEVIDPALLNTYQDGQFGAITLWHVMEHIHDLNATLQQFKRILSSEGVMLIAVPNYKSFDATYYGEYWAAYDVPRHLYHFSVDSVGLLMKNNGFTIKEIKPLFFDPYYISLLSEKYKNGWSNPIKAAWVGLQTSIKGQKNIEANSSLIYIIKKVS